MELDERKKKILKAVIQNYLETGEPVGSRTISKYTDLNLSSATIRNEMSDLEELGYIFQPHTSSGRIPSDKGYRFYVDELMEEKGSKAEKGTEVSQVLVERVDRVELLLKQMAKILAANTNYTSLVSAPQYHRTKLKFLQLSKVEGGKILAVIMSEGNMIRNTMIDLGVDITEEEILRMNVLFNGALNGLSLDEISLNLIVRLKEQMPDHAALVEKVLEAVAEAIRDDSEPHIYTSGTTNIFRYPELSDGKKASELLGAFEEKRPLNELINTAMNDDQHGIQVFIGDESPVANMKDCSVVTTHYELGDGITGVIGIVGPKRMDYEKVVGTLRTLTDQLDTIYKKKGEKE